MTDPRPTEAEARAYVLRHVDDIYVRHGGQSLSLTELPPDVAIVHIERLVHRWLDDGSPTVRFADNASPKST